MALRDVTLDDKYDLGKSRIFVTGFQALVRLCNLSEVDVIVTDAEISADHRKQIEDAGCQLIIAA